MYLTYSKTSIVIAFRTYICAAEQLRDKLNGKLHKQQSVKKLTKDTELELVVYFPHRLRCMGRQVSRHFDFSGDCMNWLEATHGDIYIQTGRWTDMWLPLPPFESN